MTTAPKHLATLLLTMIISACANKPITLTHYLLHEPASAESTQTFTQIKHNEATHYIKVDSVTFPEYLKQRRLVTMTAPSTLHYATQHLWGEPFANSFMTALKDAGAEHDMLIVSRADNIEFTQGYSAQITIVDFITNQQGMVILRGVITLDRISTEHSSTKEQLDQSNQSQYFTFNLQQPLAHDGFVSSVATMRELIFKFTKQLKDNLA